MNVVLVIADSVRADAPGYAGGAARTPFLDALARDGARFDRLFANGAWTTPSIMAMLTGCPPGQLGMARWRHAYPAGLPNLFTAFAEAGFETLAFHPYPRWGFLTVPGCGEVRDSQNPDEVVAALREGASRDRFVLIHHWWTHLPYQSRALDERSWHRMNNFLLASLGRHPERFAETLRAAYDKTVEDFSESILPRYLDAIASGGGDVLLAITGDHGETWGASWPPKHRAQNVYDLHGRWISDETIAIPCVMHGHGRRAVPAGRTIDGFASGIDIGFTLADLAGIPWPKPDPDAEGVGLCRRDRFAERTGRSLAASVIDGVPTGRSAILTVTSENAYVPRTYPARGPDMWRTHAARDDRAWYIHDGVANENYLVPLGEDAPTEVEAAAVFERLERERLACVDHGEQLDDARVAMLRPSFAGAVEGLRSLGYLD